MRRSWVRIPSRPPKFKKRQPDASPLRKSTSSTSRVGLPNLVFGQRPNSENPGVIVWGLKSKCRIHSLLRVARHTSTRPQEWEYDVRVQLESPFCVLYLAMGAQVSTRAVRGNR